MFLNLDKIQSDRLALLDGKGNSLTYGVLTETASGFAKVIDQRCLIFILCTNSIGAIVGFVGALSHHIVPLLLSADIDQALFTRLYQIYNPQYLWVPTANAENFNGKVIFTNHDFSLIETGYPQNEMDENLALLLPTSGSTGSPKLVRHSYKNLEASAANVAAFFELSVTDRPAIVLPMQYTMGLSVITSHLYAGSTLVLFTESLTDKLFWQLLKDACVTSFTGVPYSFEILSKLRFFRMDLPHLQLLTQGGGKMKDELFIQFANFCAENGKRFIATYGQTEGTARMAYLPADLSLQKTGSIGKAIPGGILSLLHEDGTETIEGEGVGEMIYKGPNVTMGYATIAEDLKKGDEFNGVLYTGDLARRDADGCYFILGRLKRFLKLYGLRIGLDECEWLVANEFNTECLCSGNDDKLLVYVTDIGCKDLVGPFIASKTGLFVKAIETIFVEEIPRNISGKPLLNA